MDKNYPLYQSMLDDLIRQIESGKLKEDKKLPSEQKLGEIYEVSRITVRRALAELERKQYIYKKQGQGSFVLSREDQNLGIRYVDTEKAIRNMGMEPHIELKQFKVIADGSEENIRQILNLDSDEYLYVIEQIYYADRKPIMLENVYLTYDRFPEIRKSEIEGNEITPFLIKKYDLRSVHFSQYSSSSLAVAKDTKNFDINVGDPIMHIKTTGTESLKTFYYSTAQVVGTLPLFLIE